MLARYPELRKSKSTMQSYIFTLNVLESIANETSQLIRNSQEILKELLEAAKVSEAQLQHFLQKNIDQVSLQSSPLAQAFSWPDILYFVAYKRVIYDLYWSRDWKCPA